MNGPRVVLASEPTLPMFDVVGWAVLIASVLITLAWLIHLYR